MSADINCVVPGSSGRCLAADCIGTCQMPAQIRERAELSTSARLREVQGALAASQADLTRAERERDEARAVVDDWCQRYADARDELAEVKAAAARNVERLTFARTELRSVELERDGVREELTRQAASNEDLTGTLAMRTGQLRASREQHVLARAELASAQQELELLRATHVPHTPEQEPK